MLWLPNTEMIVYVTQRFHWLVQPLLYMFKKYFDVPLVFFSDRLIDGCNVIEAFPRDMQIHREPCGKLIKDALSKIHKPVVSITVMDELPICRVDIDKFRILAQYMTDNVDVARGNLVAHIENEIRRCGESLWEPPGLSILKMPWTDRHIGQVGSTSMMPALWRRDFLLEFIEDHWLFGDLEIIGCRKFMKQDKWYSIASLPALVTVCHFCFRADEAKVGMSTIKNAEDRAFISQFIPEGARVT